ncbi:MAG: DUF4160 domain-containing protein [Acidobacteriota bacterium]
MLRQNGFSFMIYVDDHEPMHTHVKNGGKEVVINLGDARTAPHIRENKRMAKQEVRKALQLVYEHQDYLIEMWREIR